MGWNLVTFGDDAFKSKQDYLNAYAESNNIKTHSYSYDWLKEQSFFADNKELFESSVGKGFFSWKPFILLDAMNKLDDGEIIFYSDVNDLFHPGLIQYVNHLIEDDCCLLVMGGASNKDWTKRDCFVFMDCDEEDYWNSTQLEAGVCFWGVCEKSKQLLSEWLKYCTDRRIISDDPNVSGKDNFPSFKEHRRDQSILTNLAVKHGLSVVGSEIRDFIECNCDYWYERNSKNGFTLGRPIDKLLLELAETYPHA